MRTLVNSRNDYIYSLAKNTVCAREIFSARNPESILAVVINIMKEVGGGKLVLRQSFC